MCVGPLNGATSSCRPDLFGAGRDDTVFFSCDKTEQGRAVGEALSFLGGSACVGTSVPRVRVSPLAIEPREVQFVDKRPIELDMSNVKLVHEPEEGDPSVEVPVDPERILREEFPEPVERWNGGWHGTEESRIEYLRRHGRLWGFCRPEECRRKTACFFVRKKDGRLRKILACVNFNSCCKLPPKCELPGSWNIQKIRFRQQRFFVAESDVSAYYSRIKAPEWMKYFLCLDEVRIGDVFDLQAGERYFCPYTQQSFSADDIVCPCWPRLPMGWNWSVFLAVEKSSEILERHAPAGTVSLNITKDASLRSGEVYSGTYIDNLFSMGESKPQVVDTQRAIDRGFESAGLPLSQQDDAVEDKQLLGLQLGQGAVSCPISFLEEMMYMSQRKRVPFWMFEKVMGKSAWLFPVKRRFFAILFRAYRLLTRLRQKDTPATRSISLNAAVRAEFRAIAVLGQYLRCELKALPADRIWACDASTEGWAIVWTESGNGFVNDTGLAESPFEQYLLRVRQWRLRKRKRFRKRLDHCLAGEICAFRQTVSIASRKHPGQDIVIFTDNSNVYHSVRKGRSSTPMLNNLSRHVLLCEIVYGTRIHVRWCGTESMPADRYTRD